MEEGVEQRYETSMPIVIELGERSRKRIRKLRAGRGKLMAEIDGVIADLRTTGSVQSNVQVVVVVVKERVEPEFNRWFNCG